jgi:hypothetical protein
LRSFGISSAVALADDEQNDLLRRMSVVEVRPHLPAGRIGAGFTKREFGSMTVDQICWNACRASRTFSVTCTGSFGHGKRSDSWNVAARSFASGVVTYSPYTDAKPREKMT